MANRKIAPVVHEDSSREPAKSDSRDRRGPDETLSRMSSNLARNREKFSIENVGKEFWKYRNTKAD